MTTSELTLPDIDQMLAGDWAHLSLLLQSIYTDKQTSTTDTTASAEQLSALLAEAIIAPDHRLVDYVSEQLPAQLETQHYGILRFVDQLFTSYSTHCKLHPDISQQLKRFRQTAAQCLLNQRYPWQAQQPLAQIINRIYAQTRGWQPELGRAAERFHHQLGVLVDALCTTQLTTKSQADLQAFFDNEQQRVSKLEQRLHAAETGALHARYAGQLSAKTLNQFMRGKQLPANVSRFLQGPWRESMRLLLVSEGQSSQSWQAMLRLTETLIWSFQPITEPTAEQRMHLHDSIAELCEQLQDHTIGLHHSSQLEAELAAIDQQHLKILKGEALEYSPFELIEHDDSMISTRASVSQTLLQKAASHVEGQWFIFNNAETPLRAKLSLKIEQDQQLLFTNFLGIKTHQYSFEEFAYLLSSSGVTAMRNTDAFQATAEKTLQVLCERNLQQQQQAAEARAKEEEQQRQQQLARKAAREKALKEAKLHIEEQKAARLKRQQETEQQQLSDSKAQQHTDTLKKINAVTIGAMVLFYDDKMQSEQCRLAAIIQANGHYVFVNRQGIKQHSLSQSELTNKLLDGTAKIIDLGSNFDNTLEQVVNTIRAGK